MANLTLPFVYLVIVLGQALSLDVASIKPNNSDAPGAAGPIPHVQGDRFLAGNTSLRYLIKGAYQLHDDRLVGGPDWINSERWDIEAKAAAPGRISREQMLALLQQLLADRFQLSMH